MGQRASTVRFACRVASLLIVVAVVPAGNAGADLLPRLRGAPALVGVTLPSQGTWNNVQELALQEVARNIPVPASSDTIIFERNPTTGEYERVASSLGPSPFLERAETLGQGRFGASVTGQYLEVDEFDGHKIGLDRFQVVDAGGTPLTFFATPKAVYHLATFNFTYGLLDDLDINLAAPLMTRDYDFNVPFPTDPSVLIASHNNGDVDLGDIHARAKYHLGSWMDWEGAVGLDTRIPTGDRDEATGTNDFEIGPYVATSRMFADRLEVLLNGGFDFNTYHTRRSSAHYALGLNVIACRWATIAGAVLGRSNFDSWAESESISGPHVVDGATVSAPYGGYNFADRKDYYDANIGAKIRIGENVALSMSAFRRINDDGARSSEWSPVGSIEGYF
ncbi:MAG TPA: transporter [Candidatus Binatia bacterium]|nr:transporter [Candidatus Binatia bacterium]